MNIDDIMKMTPEEFAASWNANDDIINASYDALGITFEPVEDANAPKKD